MLNNFGFGFEVSAKDAASATLISVGKSLGALEKSGQEANQMFDRMSSRTRDLTTGRFVKAPQGILNPQFLGEVKGHLQGFALAATTLSASLTAGLGLAVHEATKFGKSVAEVASITDRAVFPVSEIERIGKEMAATYGGDLNLQVKTLYQAVSSGAANAAEATALMHAANKLAVGGLSDSFKAVDALTNVLNAYSMKMTEANKVSDALFVTAKIGKTTIDELASQIGRVAPTAAAMGVSLDDMMAAVTAGSTQLGNATAAIDGFKEALSAVLKPSSDAAAEAKRMGIDFSMGGIKAAGGFAKFFKSILENGKFTGDTINKLWGGSMTAFNMMSVLAGNSGKAFEDALKGMADKAGATDYAFNTLAETADFAQSVLKANFQTALVNLGAVVAPVIGKILTAVSRLMQKFNAASPTVHKIAAVFGVVVAAGAGLLGTLLGTGAALAGLILAGKALLIGLGIAAGAFVVLASVMLPVIALGATLYYLWTKNVGGIADRVVVWFDRIKLAFTALGQAIGDGKFSGAVQAELSKAENAGIKQFAVNAFMWFSRIKNFVMNFAAGFEGGLLRMKPVLDAISIALNRLFSRFSPVKEAASSAQEKFDAFGRTGSRMGDLLSRVVTFVAEGFLSVINFIDGAVDAWNKWKPSIDAVWGAVSGLFTAIGQLFAEITAGNGTTASSASTWQTLGQVLGAVAGAMASGIVISFRMVAGVLTWVAGLVGAVHAVFTGLVNGIMIGVQIVNALLLGEFGQAFSFAGDFISNWANTVLQMFTKIIGGAAGMIDSLGKIFGADLGLKGKVEGFAASLQPTSAPNAGGGAAPAGASPNLGTGAPGVAAAALVPQATPVAAVAPAPTLTANLKTTLQVDSRTLAEVNQKATHEAAGRGFFPTPSPTG